MRQPGAPLLSQILSARAIKHVEFLLAENLPQAVGRLEEEPLFHHVYVTSKRVPFYPRAECARGKAIEFCGMLAKWVSEKRGEE